MRHTVAIFAGVVFFVVLTVLSARAHDQYKEWTTHNGVSCCSERKEHDGHVTGDCRPVRAAQDMDGNWIAHEGGKTFLIPPHAVRPIKSPDGRSHLCEMADYIFCFVPGEVRS